MHDLLKHNYLHNTQSIKSMKNYIKHSFQPIVYSMHAAE